MIVFLGKMTVYLAIVSIAIGFIDLITAVGASDTQQAQIGTAILMYGLVSGVSWVLGFGSIISAIRNGTVKPNEILSNAEDDR